MWAGSNCLRIGFNDGQFTVMNHRPPIKCGKILEQINDYKLLKKVKLPWSQLVGYTHWQ
jgi:hypothetical protein